MMKAAQKTRGRPRIEGKRKYTLNLKADLVDALYEVEENLSAFVDSAIQKRISEPSKRGKKMEGGK